MGQWENASAVVTQRRSQGGRESGHPPNDEKVDVQEAPKSAIKSIHWKVA